MLGTITRLLSVPARVVILGLFLAGMTWGSIATALEIAIPSDMFASEVIVGDTTPGEYYYLDLFSINGQSGRYRAYLAIYDWQGQLVWYRQPNQAEERLSSFWPLENHDRFIYNLGNPNDALGLVILDSGYVPLDTIPELNPHNEHYTLDTHDFLIDDNGHYWTLWRDWRRVDMSDDGGWESALVASHVIQQWDSDHNLLWSWNGHDHTDELPYTGQHNPNNYQSPSFEQMHVNSMQLLPSGDLLVSVREMSLVILIDVPSGDIVAKLGGGPVNQWTFAVGDGIPDIAADFAVQHDARLLPNGNLTVFDNGNLHPDPYSYAKEYELDMQSQTATLVWAYADDPTSRSRFMGSVRFDDDGNALIGWGNKTPTIDGTEIAPDGSVLWSINHAPDTFNGLAETDSYRIIKSTAHGPSTLPYVTGRGTGNGLLLSCNWFGHEDEVDGYEVYYSQDEDPAFHSHASSGEHLNEDAVFSGVWFTKIRALDGNGEPISDFSEVRWFDFGNGVDEAGTSAASPAAITLLPAYPNPFNGTTTVAFRVTRPQAVTVSLHNTLGQRIAVVADGWFSPGEHRLPLIANGLASGTYLVTVRGGDGSRMTRRITLVK